MFLFVLAIGKASVSWSECDLLSLTHLSFCDTSASASVLRHKVFGNATTDYEDYEGGDDGGYDRADCGND